MYSVALIFHSWLRWVVLLAVLLALVRALRGYTSRVPWTPADDSGLRVMTIVLDVQFLIGLTLYLFLSPATQEAFNDFGFAMRTSTLRYWAVEHITGMVIAVALAHIGKVKVKKAADGRSKHARTLVYVGIALLVMLASIPWPGLSNGRALFRIS
jgi:hypothetical protein